VADDLKAPLTKITFNFKLPDFNHNKTLVKEAKKLVTFLTKSSRELAIMVDEILKRATAQVKS
jgi:hypothetical protein